jgi:hypothetical protein
MTEKPSHILISTIHICCTVVTRTTMMVMKLCSSLLSACLRYSMCHGSARALPPRYPSKRGRGNNSDNFVCESVDSKSPPLYYIWLSLSDDCRPLGRPTATHTPNYTIWQAIFQKLSQLGKLRKPSSCQPITLHQSPKSLKNIITV